MATSNIIIISTTDAETRLDRWLKRYLPHLPYTTCQKLIRTGQIRLEGRRTTPHSLLKSGQSLRFPPYILEKKPLHSPRTFSISPNLLNRWQDIIEKSILFEDDHILIINKPTGLAVQGGTKTKISLDVVLRTRSVTCAADYRLTHRLDRDTSGVIIIAKSAQEAARITNQFKLGYIKKEYCALVVSHFPTLSGVIDLPMIKRPGQQGEKMEINTAEGLAACTRYHVIEQNQNFSWVNFYPLTGRTHQIRLHSATLGCPVLGDGKYGGTRAHPFPNRVRLQLHAKEIRFESYNGKMLTFTAPLPEDMIETSKALGFLML